MTRAAEVQSGQRVVVIGGRGRWLNADFPGYGVVDRDVLVRDHMTDVADLIGERGVVVNVESHNSNPFTRYSVRLTSGHRRSGCVLDVDVAVVQS